MCDESIGTVSSGAGAAGEAESAPATSDDGWASLLHGHPMGEGRGGLLDVYEDTIDQIDQIDQFGSMAGRSSTCASPDARAANALAADRLLLDISDHVRAEGVRGGHHLVPPPPPHTRLVDADMMGESMGMMDESMGAQERARDASELSDAEPQAAVDDSHGELSVGTLPGSADAAHPPPSSSESAHSRAERSRSPVQRRTRGARPASYRERRDYRRRDDQ